MQRFVRQLIAAAALLLPVGAVLAAEIAVYKSPTCGCCSKWVRHLEANGFTVKAYDVQNVNAYKDRHGVPVPLGACHTALVEGYVVEGHVPAADIKRMLAERPKIKGLAVPGMPAGSPGMEGPHAEAYEVLSFDAAGATRVFARH
jgi:hypothetical protein